MADQPALTEESIVLSEPLKTFCACCSKDLRAGQRVITQRRENCVVSVRHANCLEIEHVPAAVDATLRQDVESTVSAAIAAVESRTPRKVEVKVGAAKKVTLDEACHAAFEKVLALAAAKKPIFLPGPSGCGKTHLAGQVAKSLKLEFAAISCSAGMSESHLLGRLIPLGERGSFEFVGTPFLERFEKGGVFLFDEIDAADPNVLLVINAALANGRLSVPARHEQPTAEKHDDFVVIAAANTYGRGADRQYVGRTEIDEATLDRFRIGTVPMDYDRDLETKLCSDDALRKRMWRYRERARENKLERVISTRFLADAFQMKQQCGWTDADVDAQLFNGWRQDEIDKVKQTPPQEERRECFPDGVRVNWRVPDNRDRARREYEDAIAGLSSRLVYPMDVDIGAGGICLDPRTGLVKRNPG